MQHGFTIAVVIPAYNEEAHIERVLLTMPSFVDHIVVVNDASEDQTLARAHGVDDKRVHILSHPINRGVGAAIATGYADAMMRNVHPKDAIAVMAGDGQMHPDDLSKLVEPIVRGEADYVKGDRFAARDVKKVMPLGRRVGGALFSICTGHAIGQTISDSQCGYTALARSACARLDLERLWPRYGYPNDLLGQLAARKMRIVEVPVRPIYAGEKSGLTLAQVPTIAALIARAWVRRRRTSTLI